MQRIERWSQSVNATGFTHSPEGVVSRRYKLLTPDDVKVLWSRWQQGENSVQISAVLGCNKDTVTWHIARAGGLRPRERRRAPQHLQPAEREEISRGLAQGENPSPAGQRSIEPAEPGRQGGGRIHRLGGNGIEFGQELPNSPIGSGMRRGRGQDFSLVKKSTKCYTWADA